MAQCIAPFKRKTGEVFPCGKCYDCKARKVNGWAFRLQKEAEISNSAFFLTLTYNQETVPISPNGLPTLFKRDVQLFMKRLRKANTNKLKYYLCGEYGGKTQRPHYHILIFNVDIETVREAWGNGFVHVGKLSEASTVYTLKYTSKEETIPMWDWDDRQKEFPLMSKGLGKNYLTKAVRKWHKADLINRVYCPLKDNLKVAMPRYYRDKIYTWHEKNIIRAFYENKDKGIDVDKSREEIYAELDYKHKIALNKIRKTTETRKLTI
jgi:hypothetical protein